MKNKKIRINGERIMLRQLGKADAQSIHEHAKDWKVSRYLSNLPHPYRLKHAKEFIKKAKGWAKKKTGHHLGIELKQTGQIIGIIGLSEVDKKHNRAVIGYWLGRKHWGKGLAREALRLMLKFGFRKLRLLRIHAHVMKPNSRSAKLLKKAGFKLEGKLRKHYVKKGKRMDALVFGLLREEHK